MKWLIRLAIFCTVFLVGPVYMALFGNISFGNDWRTADRSSVGIAPHPDSVREAIVQVYAARAFNWRGAFAVHTWLATKPEDANAFTVHEVLGWRLHADEPVVTIHTSAPDRSWYGAAPEILIDIRGEKAQALIPEIEQAVKSYPYQHDYTIWPGPNSNTFTAWVARRVPGLGLDLPTTAIGKDYLENGKVFSTTPSGTGYQLSFLGALGVSAAAKEGLEINLLGFSFGIDPLGLAIKLPGVGRVGKSRALENAPASP